MNTRSTKNLGKPQSVHTAQQERSRETLARILAAAEELLETHEFDELTMAELAKQARCGVGTVYGRIPNKQSLLVCLHERYMEAGVSKSASVVEQCINAELDVRVQKMSELVVDYYTVHRGVMRAITNQLYARSSDDINTNFNVFRRDITKVFKQAAAFLAEKVDRKIHPNPQGACEFALLAAVDVAQGRLVFGDRSGLQINFSPDTLKKHINALLLAYLQHHQN
jgi:AcrR family transcriptional regulator